MSLGKCNGLSPAAVLASTAAEWNQHRQIGSEHYTATLRLAVSLRLSDITVVFRRSVSARHPTERSIVFYRAIFGGRVKAR